jgi:predicted Zn-dependent protease
MKLDNETIQYLALTASLATMNGLRQQALDAAEALAAGRPNDPNTLMVVALAKMGSGKTEDGVKILQDKVLAAEPNRSAAKAMLGWAFSKLGRASDSERLARQVIDANDDAGAVEMAKSYTSASAA